MVAGAYATGWLVAAPIGPVNLEIIRRSLRDGLAAGFVVGLGAVCIDTLYLFLFSAGLAPLVAHPPVQLALHLLGGIVLTTLGVLAWRDAFRLESLPARDATRVHAPRHSALAAGFIAGLAMTATNPMTVAFWSSLALNFAGLPLGHRLLSAAALFAGCLSWVLTLMGTLAFARRFAGVAFFRVVTVLGGTALLFLGLRFLALAGGLP